MIKQAWILSTAQELSCILEAKYARGVRYRSVLYRLNPEYFRMPCQLESLITPDTGTAYSVYVKTPSFILTSSLPKALLLMSYLATKSAKHSSPLEFNYELVDGSREKHYYFVWIKSLKDFGLFPLFLLCIWSWSCARIILTRLSQWQMCLCPPQAYSPRSLPLQRTIAEYLFITPLSKLKDATSVDFLFTFILNCRVLPIRFSLRQPQASCSIVLTYLQNWFTQYSIVWLYLLLI